MLINFYYSSTHFFFLYGLLVCIVNSCMQFRMKQHASGKKFQEILEQAFIHPLQIEGELYIGIPSGKCFCLFELIKMQ